MPRAAVLLVTVLATLGALALEQSSVTDLTQSLLDCPRPAGAIVCATLPSLSAPRGARVGQAQCSA